MSVRSVRSRLRRLRPMNTSASIQNAAPRNPEEINTCRSALCACPALANSRRTVSASGPVCRAAAPRPSSGSASASGNKMFQSRSLPDRFPTDAGSLRVNHDASGARKTTSPTTRARLITIGRRRKSPETRGREPIDVSTKTRTIAAAARAPDLPHEYISAMAPTGIASAPTTVEWSRSESRRETPTATTTAAANANTSGCTNPP